MTQRRWFSGRLLPLAQKRLLPTTILYITTGLLFGPFSPSALAQKPVEEAPPAAAAAAIRRAEQFVRDLARLSPMPPDTDPDRAQAWPRASIRIFRQPDGQTQKYLRGPNTKVVGFLQSGRLISGRAWTVK